MWFRGSPLIRIKPVLAVATVLVATACAQLEVIPGIPPGAQADNFAQVTLGKVDVLWVVDNSGSMADKQKNVHDNLATFFNYLLSSQIDFHIAVTTTDTTPGHAGQLVPVNGGGTKVITPSTPHALEEFQSNINVGTDGSALNKGLDGARLILQLKPNDFLRDDAFLFIIFVSDGDDRSFPGDAKFFYRFYSSQKGLGNDGMVLAGGIVGPVPDGCFQADGGGEAPPATRYTDVVTLMNAGVTGSICNSNFSDTLNELGVQAVGLKRRFKLSKTPDQTTLKVTVKYPCGTDDTIIQNVCSGTPKSTCGAGNGVKTCAAVKPDPTPPSSNGWRYELATNSIVFDGTAIPPKGAAIEVVYFEKK
jgi:hypothetical protein